MGNNNIQSTHEKIHTGLSGLNNDEKWKDMLNFRCAQGETSVVPHKAIVFSAPCAGSHSMASTLGGHVYVFGQHFSYGFVGADQFHPYPLWRLSVSYLPALGLRDHDSQNLLVQGHFTGDRPVCLRVHYVSGKLSTQQTITGNPLPAPPPPAEDYGCGSNGYDNNQDGGAIVVKGVVTDEDTDEPIYDAYVQFIRLGVVQYAVRTDSRGRYSVLGFSPGYYTVKFSAKRYLAREQSIEIKQSAVVNQELKPLPPFYEGVVITCRYSNTEGPVPGGHACDAAIYQLRGNGINLGVVNLNNLSDGGDREVTITITESQAIQLVDLASRPGQLDLALVCDNTQPGFDMSYDGGLCHTDLAWVIVKSNTNAELYNGAPSGFFLTVNLVTS